MHHFQSPRTKLGKGRAIGMFLLTLFIILLIYPNVKHFRYNYRIGKPWQYQTLYAPFKFPVKKSPEQIEKERKILPDTESIPYYDFDKVVCTSQIEKASADSLISEEALLLLKNIYAEPIIEKVPNGHLNDTIYIQKDHISGKMTYSDLKTRKSIINFINRYNFKEEVKKAILSYVKSNLNYNEEQTKTFNNTKNISVYYGEIQANELIISKGELITYRSFRELESLKSEYAKRIGVSADLGFMILGQILFAGLCLFFLYLFLINYRTDLLDKPLYIIFLLLSIIFSVALTRIVIGFGKLEIFLIPYILLATIVRTFVDSRTAMFTFTSAILICSFMVPNSYEFILLQFVTGVIAILQLKRLDRRAQLIYNAFLIFVCYCLLYIALFIISKGNINNINLMVFVRFFLNSIFLTVAYPLLYLLEKTFGFLSNVTLMELSNTNHPLLRKLSQVAPGTFQHSMQMANLAEEAIIKIGGNPLLARTGALYHDIGKIEDPMYFTENQSGIDNPHKGLSYENSAQKIISHVTDGIKLAKQYNLPKQLIDFITTHHGKGRTEYFYRSYLNENPDDEETKDFSYPGPDPFTVEQAVLMMADACEAASRSLEKKTEKNIESMVNKLVSFQKETGRFNNAPITIRDIEIIKQLFIKKLSNIYHSRTRYPELKKT